MANHSSATVRSIKSVTNNSFNQTQISDVLRRRAESVIQDKSIDGDSRAIIRYALEINDPMLSQLVQWADAGESIVDNMTALDLSEDDSTDEKVEALVKMICQGDDHDTRAAALLVLLAEVENSDDLQSLAKTAKHCAFSQCAAMNVYGMVDVQVAMLERELFTHDSRLS